MRLLLSHPEDYITNKHPMMFHTLGISATSAAILAGGMVVAGVGGATAASLISSDATRRSNAMAAAGTNKYMKLASAEAERGYADTMAAIDKLGSTQSGLSGTYLSRTGKVVDEYGKEVTGAIGDFPDYYTGVKAVVDKANQNVTDLETRSKNVIKDSANQTYDYNLSRFDDFADFATRLSEENQKIRLNLARAATPMFDETRSQMALNDLQGTQGIMSATTESAITRAAAQRGLASGTGAGSPLKLNSELRHIGLTVDAEKNAAAERFQARQLQDYNTLVAGTQVGMNDVYNWMGLNTNKVIDVNNENSWKLFDAQKLPLDYAMVGLNTSLDKRFDLYTNKASFWNAANSNVYGQESEAARQAAVLAAAASEARTNAKLGIAGNQLAGSYAAANRTNQQGLVTANLVSNTTASVIGGVSGVYAGYLGNRGTRAAANTAANTA
jgi:hypothetical protein